MLLRSNFSSFPHYYIYIFLTPGVKLHIHLLNVVVQFIVFLTLSTLICRGRDIWKCFRESLGNRDNESRLYNKSMALYISPSFLSKDADTIFDLIVAHTPISAQSSNPWSSDYSQCTFCLLLYKGICCEYSFELHQCRCNSNEYPQYMPLKRK